MKRSLIVVAVVFCTAMSGLLWAQDNPFSGTWKLNTAKSKFEPGPGPKSMTRTIVAQGAGASYSFEGVGADGASIAYSFSTNYDGKDSAITGAGARPVERIRLLLSESTLERWKECLRRTEKRLGRW
jgi:hypothetical protein